MISRRNLLRGSAVAATAGSLNTLFGISRAFAQEASGENDNLQTILNVAATAELFASTHYLAGIDAAEAGNMEIEFYQLNYLKAAFVSERDHLDLLIQLGAEPVVSEFYVPDGLYTDYSLFGQITEVAETAFVAAYLAATRIFAEAGDMAFAVTAAQIAGVESEHRAIIRDYTGLLPNDRSYEAFLYNNVSDAVPVLQGFLDGSGDGFVGPVQPPNAGSVRRVRSQVITLGYNSDIAPYAAM
jgi:hypothetical protein